MGCDPTGKVTQLHSFVSLCCTHKHNPVHSDHQHGWPSSSHSFLSTPLMNHWQDPYALNPLSCKLAAKQKQSKTPACSFYVILVFMKQALFSRHLMGRFGLAGSIRKDSHRLIRHGLSVCFGSLPAGPVPSQWVAIQVSKQLIEEQGVRQQMTLSLDMS